MKVKLIIISIILLLVMVFASGCIPVLEKLGLVSPTNEEQLSPEKGGPPDGLVKVLIGFKEKPGAAQQAMVKGVGGKIKYTYHIVDAIAASIPEKAIVALKKNPNIRYVEPDGQVFALEQTLPWGVDRIDAEVVHASESANKGEGVKVAILDTGIDLNHPDLYVTGGASFVSGKSYDDKNGHGTHVAGIVAALDDGDGVIGVAPDANLYAVKVLNNRGMGWVSDIIAGLEWSVSEGMQVVNMSLGGAYSETLEKACQAADDAGLLLVAAAGNDGSVIFPAAYSSVIAVSATNSADGLAYFSSVGDEVELAAPGVDIYSTYKDGGYATMDGTSMASPHVAGTAALVWAANGWSNDAVRTQLQSTAENIGLSTRKQGYGLVDAENAVLGTTKGNNLPTQQATGTITGTVTNMSTGDAIEGAKVTADVYFDFTTNDGTYILDDIPVETYTVTASAIGYSDSLQEGIIVEENQTTLVNFALSPLSTIPKLFVDVNTNKDSDYIYIIGESVYITITVTENDENEQTVEDTSVQIEITTASERKYTKDGVTDSDGKVTFKFKIKKPDGKGAYSVTANATKSGYVPGSDSTAFDVN